MLISFLSFPLLSQGYVLWNLLKLWAIRLNSGTWTNYFSNPTASFVTSGEITCPGPYHIFSWLGPAPSTPLSLPGLPACTCVGTLPRWELLWQYRIKITNIQVDITFIIPKLIDVVPSHVKGDSWLKWLGIVTLVPNRKEFPRMCGREDRTVKEAWEGWGQPNENVT